VDIHSDYLTIDQTKIEAAITSKTTGILATHVFGNPCAVEEIEVIAKKYNLKVIYDAAHCFGVTYKGKSIFEYGDISTCSFHATKLFHTGEGGAMFTNDNALLNTLFYHHNFGHKGKEDFQGLGINAKMSEMQAAMGLAVLPYMKTILEVRKRTVELYTHNLKGVCTMKLRDETLWNYSYYPILFREESQLRSIQQLLNNENIFPRRYFYPSLNLLPYADKKPCPISENISLRVLCLPLFHDLDENSVLKICDIINRGL
jgi:dTDP-4-amino-4,6-dideoxygalactose transaminase